MRRIAVQKTTGSRQHLTVIALRNTCRIHPGRSPGFRLERVLDHSPSRETQWPVSSLAASWLRSITVAGAAPE